MIYCGYWIGSNFFPCFPYNIATSHAFKKITLSIFPKQKIQTPELINRIVFGDKRNFFIYDGLLFQAEHANGYEYLATRIDIHYQNIPIQEDQIYTYMETLATEFTFKNVTLL